MQHTELGTSWYSHGPQKIIPRSINPGCQFHKMKYRLTKLENRYFHYPKAITTMMKLSILTSLYTSTVIARLSSFLAKADLLRAADLSRRGLDGATDSKYLQIRTENQDSCYFCWRVDEDSFPCGNDLSWWRQPAVVLRSSIWPDQVQEMGRGPLSHIRDQ